MGPRVLRDDFIRFANEKGITLQCPSCLAPRTWTIRGLDDANMLLTSLAFGTAPGPGQYGQMDIEQRMRPMVETMCTNCGFTRLYSYYHILEWLIKQGTPEPGTPEMQP